MHNHILSIGAINQCMQDLGLNKKEKLLHKVDAQIYNFKNRSFGNITVTFNCNWQSGDGPYIEVDDVIRGYGIQYESFKPQWQEFTYNKEEKKMIVKGEEYEFSLTF